MIKEGLQKTLNSFISLSHKNEMLSKLDSFSTSSFSFSRATILIQIRFLALLTEAVASKSLISGAPLSFRLDNEKDFVI